MGDKNVMAETLPDQIVRLSTKMGRADAHIFNSLWCEHTDEFTARYKLDCLECVKEMVDYYDMEEEKQKERRRIGCP